MSDDDVREGNGRFRKGIGKGYVHKPPRGEPASGAGWGGSAKGVSAAPFEGGAIPPAPADRKAVKLARSLEMETVLYDIAKNGEEHGTVRVQAADKLYQIYNGKPIERVIVDEQPIERDYIDPNELSPEARDELRAALERQKATEDDAKRSVN